MLALSFAFYTNEAGLRKRNRDSKYSMSSLINLDPSAYASDSLAFMRIRALGSRLHLDGMYAGFSMRMRILLCWRLRRTCKKFLLGLRLCHSSDHNP